MRKYNFILIALFCIVTSGLASHTANAQDTKIGVLNVQKIMNQASAAVDIQKQLDSKRKKFQEEFTKYEKELVEKEKKLVEARATMNPEEFNAQKQQYENDWMETRKLVTSKQKALEKAASEALTKLRNEIYDIVKTISEKEGLSIVFTGQNIIYSAKELDITDPVMKQLNKDLKSITLKVDDK